jgi:hypothetical protein
LVKVNPADPDTKSATVTVTVTGTILWFGGQREFGLALQITAGGDLSILTVTEDELDKPAPLVAEQVRVVPVVSFESTVTPQSVDEEIPWQGNQPVCRKDG